MPSRRCAAFRFRLAAMRPLAAVTWLVLAAVVHTASGGTHVVDAVPKLVLTPRQAPGGASTVDRQRERHAVMAWARRAPLLAVSVANASSGQLTELAIHHGDCLTDVRQAHTSAADAVR